ncbi:Myb-related protein [Nymphaea thermarum]|nr:Myb-related protein [Nymphaea thermarum]
MGTKHDELTHLYFKLTSKARGIEKEREREDVGGRETSDSQGSVDRARRPPTGLLRGEKRWDFIAKVSGLNRTGKSCRLRWVNYLRPDLKRGRMIPREESLVLVLELHARWGNSNQKLVFLERQGQ